MLARPSKPNRISKCYVVVIVIATFLFGCDTEKSVPAKELLITKVNDIFLPLDSITSNSNKYYQSIKTDSADYLAFLNEHNTNLYIYDVHSQKLFQKIAYQKEGPNGLGTLIPYFSYVNSDSIIFHSYYRDEIIVTNDKGEVKSRRTLSDENIPAKFRPVSGAGYAPVQLNNSLYFNSGMTCNYSEDMSVSAFYKKATKGEDSSLEVEFPSVYNKELKDYWPEQLCNPFTTINETSQLMIISFPLNPEVITIDKNGAVNRHYFGNSEFFLKDALKQKEYSQKPLEEFKKLLSFPRYGAIFYDPYRKIYLRRFTFPSDQKDLDSNRLKSKMKFIVADQQFNLIGEFDYLGGNHIYFDESGINEVVFNSRIEDSLKIKRFQYAF